MASLYPSLEDMNVDQMARAQLQASAVAHAVADSQASAIAAGQQPIDAPTSLYAGLGLEELLGTDYLGLDMSEISVYNGAQAGAAAAPQQQLQVAAMGGQQLAMPGPGAMAASSLPGANAIASITPKQDLGMRRAEIKQGVREVILAKDGNGKLGIATKSIDKGVFVSFVWSNSAAALGGLRFGDQILQIDGQTVAGWNEKKTLKVLKEADAQRISIVVRDRPWCRTLTAVKDAHNHIGFTFKDGESTNIVKDSSAARNGMLINHRLVEVNGQNVVGVKDKEIQAIIQQAPRSVTLTIMPSFVYKHLVKKIGSSMLKKYMDHGVPEV